MTGMTALDILQQIGPVMANAESRLKSIITKEQHDMLLRIVLASIDSVLANGTVTGVPRDLLAVGSGVGLGYAIALLQQQQSAKEHRQ